MMTQAIKTFTGVALAMLFAGTASSADEKQIGKKPDQTSLVGAKKPQTCQTLPPDKRVVRFNLEPDTKVGDLIAWISTITCKQFLLPGTISADTTVTVVAPALITPSEAYRLFLGALDSVGLTIEHTGKFERIVETAKIKTIGGIPGPHEGSDLPSSKSYVTRLFRVDCLDPHELARLLKNTGGQVVTLGSREVLIITDTVENMNRIGGNPDSNQRFRSREMMPE